MSTTGTYKLQAGSEDGAVHKAGDVCISIKQPVAQVMKVAPPVSAKPTGKKSPMMASVVDGAEDFPPPPDDMLAPIVQKKPTPSIEDELDALTDILALSLQNSNDPTFYGVCCKCRNTISGEKNCCTAMGEKYHITCLTCEGCKVQLMGGEFFCLNDTPYCERCYNGSLEDCARCRSKITDRILKAIGQSFHPHCFVCISCTKNLDGVSFTMDAANTVHCMECYQLRFSPRCVVCEELIMPTSDNGETVHIVSMQKNFHVECYRCEDCNLSLSSEGGRGCYPLDGHLLCQRCNTLRMQKSSKASSRMSTTL